MSPVRPQGLLVRIGESCAAHDEASFALRPFRFASTGDVVGLGNLGFASVGVEDVNPGVGVDRDRSLDPGTFEVAGEFPVVEPAVGARRERSGRSTATDSSDEFFAETFHASLDVC